MARRSRVLWTVSAVLLIWIGAMAIMNARCEREGMSFSVLGSLSGSACVPAGPPIILQRDLQRG